MGKRCRGTAALLASARLCDVCAGHASALAHRLDVWEHGRTQRDILYAQVQPWLVSWLDFGRFLRFIHLVYFIQKWNLGISDLTLLEGELEK